MILPWIGDMVACYRTTSNIDKTLETPDEWDEMKIKSTHKKGLAKTKMKNKRGLFITNLISKVYERVIKKRNEECFKLSPMQTAGIRKRSTIDNIMVLLAMVERNTISQHISHFQMLKSVLTNYG